MTAVVARKYLLLMLKIVVALAALWLVFSQLDWQAVWGYALAASPLWLVMAFALILLGQVLSALRMRFYLNAEGAKMPHRAAILIYFIGMFFNLILPGGIGGDGYKAWIIKRRYGLTLKRAVQRILSSRANGLLALLLIFYAMAGLSPALVTLDLPVSVAVLLAVMAVVTLVAYVLAVRLLLSENSRLMLGAFPYSVVIQLTVVATAWLLLLSLGHGGAVLDYLLLFMVSSFISILPISIGGVGLRELTFFYGAVWFGLDQELGVVIALLYFVVNGAASLLGMGAFMLMRQQYDDIAEKIDMAEAIAEEAKSQ